MEKEGKGRKGRRGNGGEMKKGEGMGIERKGEERGKGGKRTDVAP